MAVWQGLCRFTEESELILPPKWLIREENAVVSLVRENEKIEKGIQGGNEEKIEWIG